MIECYWKKSYANHHPGWWSRGKVQCSGRSEALPEDTTVHRFGGKNRKRWKW